MIAVNEPSALNEALRAASETRALKIGPHAARETARIFHDLFGSRPAIIVADKNTFRAAGETVSESFRAARQPLLPPFIFCSPSLHAEHQFVVELETALKKHQAIPIAVGSGTINDLAKLASHRAGRQYITVATAASMDGYTSFGASITFQGSKQTFKCPAPAAVVADLNVLCAAPAIMNAWGYADLVAKITAGADWIVADALGVEPIVPEAWNIVQSRLATLVADAGGVSAADPKTIAWLVEGLTLCGFAMQAIKSSRPASGAEHQFSHLWDMQHHLHDGATPSHGFKVGIGTLAVTALYESLLKKGLDDLNVEHLCETWPDQPAWVQQAHQMFGSGELGAVAAQEIAAKACDPQSLRIQLKRLRQVWPQLKERLHRQLFPFNTLKGMLQAAGAPTEPEQIGITRERLRESFWQAYFIRRRFTVLDLAVHAGLLDECLEEIFGARGLWPVSAPPHRVFINQDVRVASFPASAGNLSAGLGDQQMFLKCHKSDPPALI
jgi:glycerol-1-phosphate dehydrogenase [NAD(P)+]